jgi:hypothetical protein
MYRNAPNMARTPTVKITVATINSVSVVPRASLG